MFCDWLASDFSANFPALTQANDLRENSLYDTRICAQICALFQRRGTHGVAVDLKASPWSLGAFAERLQHPVGLGRLGRHNDDRESRAPPWPPLAYSDGSTAAVIYQTSRCNGKFAHHRTSPAYRGLGAVDNVISIEAGGWLLKLDVVSNQVPAASAACPSGAIYTSFQPDICAGLLSGISAAPLSVGLPSEFGFADQMTPLPG
ncbi:hypothetical protein THAOC_14534 [Thalassiosira oceanica]|uniref:Uncharacterized protein n=1 Tax=Thalassiosira oceanica TaxID=159749 RepID=K0SIF2_THAOC|nr:hypothetical protein THAOC_14534 [Thalassiosira oceanica]|eukprot:EJK64704.1 hypothetical protein THAOC_14534 [Thalassiosira oceanica]